MSHDFIARAVARFLGRRRGQILRRAAAYAAPALLAIAVLSLSVFGLQPTFAGDYVLKLEMTTGVESKIGHGSLRTVTEVRTLEVLML